MKSNVRSVAVGLACLLPVVVGAQSGSGMSAQMDSQHAEMTKEVTFAGCLAAAPSGGTTFVLTGATMAAHRDGAMAKDGSMHEMSGHEMSGHAMDDHGMHGAGTSTLTLSSTRVDLAKYAGRKVSVTGTESHERMDMSKTSRSTLTVTSLKTLAKSCS